MRTAEITMLNTDLEQRRLLLKT